MKLRHFASPLATRLAFGALGAVIGGSGYAQLAPGPNLPTSPAAASASAVPRARDVKPREPRPAPRLMTPEEQRQNGESSSPATQDVERPFASPQLAIPIGRAATASDDRSATRAATQPPARTAQSATGVSDAAARCEADKDAAKRKACREGR